MICEAETKAACSVQAPDNTEGEFAISIVASFERVSKIVDLTVPLRRPIRSTPRPMSDARGTISNELLRSISKKHQPPQEWFEGEEEPLF